MAAITSTQAAQAIAQILAADVLDHLQANIVLPGLINRDFSQEIAQHGDTVTVNLPPTLVANNLAEGGSVATQNPNVGGVSVTLDTHAESSFVIPDVTQALARPDLIGMYTESAAIAIAERMESDVMGLYPGFTTNADLGTAGTDLVEAVIDDAERVLFTQKLPDSRPRYLVLTPDGYSDVRQIARFTEEDNVVGAGEAIRTGFVGTIKGFRVFRSQLTKITAGSPDTHHCIAFGRDALMMVTRRLPRAIGGPIVAYANRDGYEVRVILSYDKDTLAQQVTVDTFFGVSVLREQWGVEVNR